MAEHRLCLVCLLVTNFNTFASGDFIPGILTLLSALHAHGPRFGIGQFQGLAGS
jgi:hypothetical protein